MTLDTIHVFQRNFAFTHKDAEKPILKTGSFGPCCVVTCTGGNYAAMAHMDTMTNVESLASIFDQFKKHSVTLKDIKVIILGGWSDNQVSKKLFEMVLDKIHLLGIENIHTKRIFSKQTLSIERLHKNISEAEALLYYHYGAQIDARSGDTFILKKPQIHLDSEQKNQNRKFVAQNPKRFIDIAEVF